MHSPSVIMHVIRVMTHLTTPSHAESTTATTLASAFSSLRMFSILLYLVENEHVSLNGVFNEYVIHIESSLRRQIAIGVTGFWRMLIGIAVCLPTSREALAILTTADRNSGSVMLRNRHGASHIRLPDQAWHCSSSMIIPSA